jgi:hypothetical protein
MVFILDFFLFFFSMLTSLQEETQYTSGIFYCPLLHFELVGTRMMLHCSGTRMYHPSSELINSVSLTDFDVTLYEIGFENKVYHVYKIYGNKVYLGTCTTKNLAMMCAILHSKYAPMSSSFDPLFSPTLVK